MKVSGFCVLLLVAGTALTFFNLLSPTGASWFPDLVATNCGDKTTLIPVSRKLKENGSSIRSNIKKKGNIGEVTLNDYNPIDPVPSSSKAAVNPGPIEHGTPTNPYVIPKPPPPSHPRPGDYN
ncbi:uncharacterized protein LOC113848409 [Abrus precatorius]|uniref:Uncharacterized protein LOC113848409 n=1 Tax=Abrus precatorius TaxID=3816 RepID=A0A8B8JQX4_ABRPR|nr:uncharacterized protein LOC113848409 [Abrus precatorius]